MEVKSLCSEKLFDKKTIVFTIGLIFIIIGTTFCFIKFGLASSLGLKDAGVLGDTIGGIAGPIINLLGAVLVYKSFIAQISANKIQLKNIESDRAFNTLWELYKEIKNDIDNFEYLYVTNNPNSNLLRGLQSFERLVNELNYDYSLVMDNKKFIIQNLSFLLKNIALVYEKIDSSHLNDTDRELIQNKMTFIYKSQLETYANKIAMLLKDSENDLKLEINKSLERIKNTTKLIAI